MSSTRVIRSSVADLGELWTIISEWPLVDMYWLFDNLRTILYQNMPQLQKYIDIANDPERVKQILSLKKEEAIVAIRNLLPYVRREPEAMQMYLRILPIYFSHSTLHDTEVERVYVILMILRLRDSSSTREGGIFDQWYEVFRRRATSKKFTYKDENCVRNLPVVMGSRNFSEFAHCIGYVDIHLFRNFHRWLRLLRLHKYLFMFANMSYEQIMGLNEENFGVYEKQFDIVKVTIGAKAKILREIDRLRHRRQHLEEIFKMPLANSLAEIEETIRNLKRILRTPIPIEDNFNENLPQWIVRCLQKIFQVIITSPIFDQLLDVIYGLFVSLLKEAWNYNIFSTEEKNSFNEWRTILSERRSSGANGFSKHSDPSRNHPFQLPNQKEAVPFDFFSMEPPGNDTIVPGFENMIHLFSNRSMIETVSGFNTNDDPFSHFGPNDQYCARDFFSPFVPAKFVCMEKK